MKRILRIFQRIVIPGINGILLAGLLFAGLWPFKFLQKNNCRSDKSTGALEFYKNGFACSKIPPTQSFLFDDFFSVDLEIIPVAKPGYTACVMSMYNKKGEFLTIRQWRTFLVIQSGTNKTSFSIKSKLGDKIHLTCKVTQSGVDAWCGGEKRTITREANLCKGQELLVMIGNTGALNSPWTGELYNLQIKAGHSHENRLAQSDAGNMSHTKEEQQSNINLILWPDTGTNMSSKLRVPSHLFPLRPEILVPPWVDFKADKKYYADVIINYLGFIPSGFFLGVLLGMYLISKRMIFVVTFSACVVISLFIELAQVILPTRSSQLSDVLLNCAGGLTGSVVYFGFMAMLRKARILYK